MSSKLARCVWTLLMISSLYVARFEATVSVASTHYETRVENPSHRCRGVSHADLDGLRIHHAQARVSVPLDGGTHSLLISI